MSLTTIVPADGAFFHPLLTCSAARCFVTCATALYVVALLALAAGAAFGGYVVTVIAVSLLVLRFAERRSWTHAIVYGVACAVIGLVGFGWLLRVDLPESPIERAFYSLVR